MGAQQTLTGVGLFADLDPAERDKVAKRCRWRRYAAGEQIIGYADQSAEVYFFVEGEARVTFFTKAGKQVTFRDVPTGGFVGEMAAIDGEARSASVGTLTDASVASTT